MESPHRNALSPSTQRRDNTEIRVDVAEHSDELLAVRDGRVGFDAIRNRALTLDREFKSAFEFTALPERPETERVNAFLISARRQRAKA
jgi:hypothetical protein